MMTTRPPVFASARALSSEGVMLSSPEAAGVGRAHTSTIDNQAEWGWGNLPQASAVLITLAAWAVFGNGVGGLRPEPHCSLNSTSPHRHVLLLTYLHTDCWG